MRVHKITSFLGKMPSQNRKQGGKKGRRKRIDLGEEALRQTIRE